MTDRVGSISVIVPAYNAASYIVEALQSVLSQTRQPNEIIVVDDGSNDGTDAAVLSVPDPRIKYRWKENEGVSTARNRGLAEAQCDYIAFLDADDRWLPTMLEEQGALLDARPDVVFSFTNFRRFLEISGEFLGDQFQFYHGLSALASEPGPVGDTRVLMGDAFLRLIPLWDYPAYTQANCYRRSALEGIRFSPQLRRCEDLDFTLRVAMRGRVAYNPHPLVEVRRHGKNLTADDRRMSGDKLQALLILSEAVHGEEHLRAFNDRLVRAYFDAAGMHLRFAEGAHARSAVAGAWSVSGSLRRKLVGTLRYAVNSLRTSGSQ